MARKLLVEIEVEGEPQPIMQVDFNELGLTGELMFEYQLEPPQRIAAFSAQDQVLQWSTRNSCKRMIDKEKKTLDVLSKIKDLSFIEEDHHYSIEMENVQDVLRELEKAKIILFGKERRIKSYSKVQLELSSKVDWFEVKGTVDFGGEKVAIGEMLDAIRSNSRYVLLSNGEYGLLPEQWIAKNKHLFEMAEGKDGNLEVQKNQFLLLKQLTEGGDSSVSVKNNKGLKDLKALAEMTEDFTGLEVTQPPEELQADLRNYQASGLSWLRFLKNSTSVESWLMIWDWVKPFKPLRVY